MQLSIETKQGKPFWGIIGKGGAKLLTATTPLNPPLSQPLKNNNSSQAIAGVVIFTNSGKWWGGEIGSDIHLAFRQGLTSETAVTQRERLEESLAILTENNLVSEINIRAFASAGRINFAIKIDQNDILRIL